MIKRILCWILGHERSMSGRRLFYAQSDLTEVTVRHEFLCIRCNRWVKL